MICFKVVMGKGGTMFWFLVGLVIGGLLGIIIMAVLSATRDGAVREVRKNTFSSYDSPSVN